MYKEPLYHWIQLKSKSRRHGPVIAALYGTFFIAIFYLYGYVFTKLSLVLLMKPYTNFIYHFVIVILLLGITRYGRKNRDEGLIFEPEPQKEFLGLKLS